MRRNESKALISMLTEENPKESVFHLKRCVSFVVPCLSEKAKYYVQQRSIPLRAIAFRFATSNSFQVRYVEQLVIPLRATVLFQLRSLCAGESAICVS